MSATRDGGKPNVKQMPYSPPQGPRKMMDKSVRSGHVEPGYGTKGESLGEMPGREMTGHPGIGGTNLGNKGSQGRH